MPGSEVALDYLDASVLLAYVQGEEGRAGVIDGLLQDALDGKRRLCTSVLSIVEVAYTATDAGGSDDDLTAIEELWTPASPILVVDMSDTIARRARALVRAANSAAPRWRLRPPDAIHLASAMLAGAQRVLTYEKDTVRQCC